MKNVLLVIIVLFLFPYKIYATENQPKAHILFINQIRGEECCNKGNLSNLKDQINKFIEAGIPAYFAIRYDVINNPVYLSYLKSKSRQYPNIIRLGLLLEITPQLAKDFQVTYRGSTKKWYEAQNIYSIGYSQKDNQKLMDAIFSKFYNSFGYYPKLTSSWMIKTQTLNYIHDKYKVKIHQITKEQWGTDSYTLYGGPPHYPYPAGYNWAFIPDYDRPDAPLIVRQTITDPLLNYGDNTNSFTSQPNDYMHDKKTFDYFKNLIDQAVNQPGIGFALLGLENSMDKTFNDEYLKQIDYVKDLIKNNSVITPSINDFQAFWSKEKITVYQGKDLVNQTDNNVYWITAPKYRVRLRVKENSIAITDLRIFNQNYIDPYTNYLAKKEGFWIVPYLIDGSHGYLPIVKQKTLVDSIAFDARNDENLDITSIKLPSRLTGNNLIVKNQTDSVKIQYQNDKNNRTLITFSNEEISINCPSCKSVTYNNHNPHSHPIKYEKKLNGFSLKWTFKNKISQLLNYECKPDKCKFTFSSSADLLAGERIKQYPYLFPEPINRKIDPAKTIVYLHNQYAVAGRNPVRIIIIPVDIYNIPVKVNEPIEISTEDRSYYSQTTDGLIQYFDITNNLPTMLNLKVKIKNKEIKNVKAFFAPDCKKNIKHCLLHPVQSWWYINSFIGDKYRRYILNENR